MLKCTLLLSIVFLTCVDSSSRRLSCGRTHFPAYLSNDGINEHNLHKRWRIHTEHSEHLEKLIKSELYRLIEQTSPDKSTLLKHTSVLDSLVNDIIGHIVPKRFELFLNKYKVAEFVEKSNYIDSFMSLFRKKQDPVVYSVWQYRPNVFSPGGTLTIEVSYKLKISLKDHQEFYFAPIVVFQCDVRPGKYMRGSVTFDNGSAELHTHRFLPWHHHSIGKFSIRPAHLSTLFKNSQF